MSFFVVVVVVVVRFVVRDLCSSGCRQNFVNFFLHRPPPFPPSPPPTLTLSLILFVVVVVVVVFFLGPTHNSLLNTSDSYLKSLRA